MTENFSNWKGNTFVLSGSEKEKHFKKGRKNDAIPVYGARNAASILESLKNLVSYPLFENDDKKDLLKIQIKEESNYIYNEDEERTLKKGPDEL